MSEGAQQSLLTPTHTDADVLGKPIAALRKVFTMQYTSILNL